MLKKHITKSATYPLQYCFASLYHLRKGLTKGRKIIEDVYLYGDGLAQSLLLTWLTKVVPILYLHGNSCPID